MTQCRLMCYMLVHSTTAHDLIIHSWHYIWPRKRILFYDKVNCCARCAMESCWPRVGAFIWSLLPRRVETLLAATIFSQVYKKEVSKTQNNILRQTFWCFLVNFNVRKEKGDIPTPTGPKGWNILHLSVACEENFTLSVGSTMQSVFTW